jgi:hypothetical protein
MAGIGVIPEVRFRNQFGQFISDIEAGGEAAREEIRAHLEAAAKAQAPKRKGTLAAATVAVKRGNAAVAFTGPVFNKQGGTYQDKVQDGIPGIWPTKDHGALANKEEGFFVKGPVGPRAPNNYLVRAYKLVWPNAVRIVDANIN